MPAQQTADETMTGMVEDLEYTNPRPLGRISALVSEVTGRKASTWLHRGLAGRRLRARVVAIWHLLIGACGEEGETVAARGVSPEALEDSSELTDLVLDLPRHLLVVAADLSANHHVRHRFTHDASLVVAGWRTISSAGSTNWLLSRHFDWCSSCRVDRRLPNGRRRYRRDHRGR